MNGETSVLLDGLLFPECPRWHEGKLWFSDMHAHCIMTVDLAGRTEHVLEVPGQPSGLGWLPDGRMLAVSMTDRRLLRLDQGTPTMAVHLSHLTSSWCNDMVVDRDGRAYIGTFGYDLLKREPFAPAELILVEPDGRVRIVASHMAFPNGIAITDDGHTLIVAETVAARLVAFDIAPDGSLLRRRLWAQFARLSARWSYPPCLPAAGCSASLHLSIRALVWWVLSLVAGVYPDGICLDAECAVWVASPLSREVLRVREGGIVTHRLRLAAQPYACMLGGPDGRTLFICTAQSVIANEVKVLKSGRIEIMQVEVPAAGWP